MKKPGGTRQGRPCAGSALTARAGPIAPACGRLCPRLCRPLVSARRSRGRSRLPAAAFARRIGRVAGPLAACPFSGAVTMLLPCTSCLGASRRAQGACRISGPGGGRPCGARAPRVRVLEPRRPARAARDRACRRPPFSCPPACAPLASASRAARGGEHGPFAAAAAACPPVARAGHLHRKAVAATRAGSCATSRPWIPMSPRIRARRSS